MVKLNNTAGGKEMDHRHEPRCSFCGKSHEEAGQLTKAAGETWICKGCSRICRDTIGEGSTDHTTTGRYVPFAVPTPEVLLASVQREQRQPSVGECVFGLITDIRAAMKRKQRRLELPLDTFDSVEQGSKIKELLVALGWNAEVCLNQPDGDYFLISW